MTEKEATPRSGHYDGVKGVQTEEDAQMIAQRTEQGGWILGACAFLCAALPVLMEAMGI